VPENYDVVDLNVVIEPKIIPVTSEITNDSQAVGGTAAEALSNLHTAIGALEDQVQDLVENGVPSEGGTPAPETPATLRHTFSTFKITDSAGRAGVVRRADQSVGQNAAFSGAALNTASLATYLGSQAGYWREWQDQTGSAVFWNPIEPQNSNQPSYDPTIFMGNPGLLCDGTNSYLYDNNVTAGPVGGWGFVFCVLPTLHTGIRPLGGFATDFAPGGQELSLYLRGDTGTIAYRQDGVWQRSGVAAPTGPCVVAFRFAESGASIYLNGDEIASNLPYTNTALYDVMQLAAVPGYSERFAGVFGEVQIFQGTPSDTQIRFTSAAMMGRFFKDVSTVPIKTTPTVNDALLGFDKDRNNALVRMLISSLPNLGVPGLGGGSGAGNVIDVRKAPYNATGTNIIADTAAIQSAIQAAHNAGGGEVLISKDPTNLNNTITTNRVLFTTLKNVTIRVERGATWRKADGESNEMIGIGSNTFAEMHTESQSENIRIIADGLIRGKGRVNAKYLGSGGGSWYAATWVSPGVVDVDGDQRHVFLPNVMVFVGNSGFGTVADQILTTAATYDSVTNKTRIATSGTFGNTAANIRLTIDNSDNGLMLRRCRNVKILGNFGDFGNGCWRTILTSEGVIWYDADVATTYISYDASSKVAVVECSGDRRVLFPVGKYARLRAGGTARGYGPVSAVSYDAGTDKTTVSLTVVRGGTPASDITEIDRSFIDAGTFRGDVEICGFFYNIAQFTTNDSAHEGIYLHGSVFYQCGPVKLTAKSLSGPGNRVVNNLFRECGMSVWLQGASGTSVRGNIIIDSTGVSGFEDTLIHYNDETVTDEPMQDIEYVDNWHIRSGSIYMIGRTDLVSQNIDISRNKIIDRKHGRQNVAIYWAGGKFSVFRCSDNVIEGGPSDQTGIAIVTDMAANDNHRETLDVTGNIITGITGAAPLIIRFNGAFSRNLRGGSIIGNVVMTPSSVGMDLRGLEDFRITHNRLRSGIPLAQFLNSTVSHNNITGGTGNMAALSLLAGSNNNSVTDNTLIGSGTATGLAVAASSGNSVTDNTIRGGLNATADTTIYSIGDGMGNAVRRNKILADSTTWVTQTGTVTASGAAQFTVSDLRTQSGVVASTGAAQFAITETGTSYVTRYAAGTYFEATAAGVTIATGTVSGTPTYATNVTTVNVTLLTGALAGMDGVKYGPSFASTYLNGRPVEFLQAGTPIGTGFVTSSTYANTPVTTVNVTVRSGTLTGMDGVRWRPVVNGLACTSTATSALAVEANEIDVTGTALNLTGPNLNGNCRRNRLRGGGVGNLLDANIGSSIGALWLEDNEYLSGNVSISYTGVENMKSFSWDPANIASGASELSAAVVIPEATFTTAVEAIPGVSLNGLIKSEYVDVAAAWVTLAAGTLTRVSASQFTINNPGIDNTANFPQRRKVRFWSGGEITGYGYVTSSSYDGTGITTVNMLLNAGALLSNLTLVEYWTPGQARASLGNLTGGAVNLANSTWLMQVRARR
jgi:Periplasmic copper-binding protein (NosD)